MNWGVLLVIGGGFAMANASDLSGFSSWFASGLQRAVENLPTYAIAIIVSILAALFTEICSNTAATALFVPLLAELREVFRKISMLFLQWHFLTYQNHNSTRLCINPLYLLLPATLACSLSFMLPGKAVQFLLLSDLDFKISGDTTKRNSIWKWKDHCSRYDKIWGRGKPDRNLCRKCNVE